MLFTDDMIEHIAHHPNLYSAQELGDPIKTSPQEIEHFLAMLLFMGVFNFPSLEDYWHHESRFNMWADHQAALHHQRRPAAALDRHDQDHNQMCATTAWDIGLVTGKSEGDETIGLGVSR
ncbi:hypothetical protein WMY93_014457 [Mugilogobius chulae]|uniref:PiggyBac transposable element-derived protein domain-containing protein n=1 Tax=Mugilogobius chulae TaxID=88201 RepID=A0AAW0NZ95_9GOBI